MDENSSSFRDQLAITLIPDLAAERESARNETLGLTRESLPLGDARIALRMVITRSTWLVK